MNPDKTLYSIYGNIYNHKVRTIRMICRDILSAGVEEFLIKKALGMGIKDIQSDIEAIEELGGSSDAIKRLEEIKNVHEYAKDNPNRVSIIIRQEYEEEFSTDGRVQCNWQSNPKDKSECWGCNVPVNVYNRLEEKSYGSN